MKVGIGRIRKKFIPCLTSRAKRHVVDSKNSKIIQRQGGILKQTFSEVYVKQSDKDSLETNGNRGKNFIPCRRTKERILHNFQEYYDRNEHVEFIDMNDVADVLNSSDDECIGMDNNASNTSNNTESKEERESSVKKNSYIQD